MNSKDNIKTERLHLFFKDVSEFLITNSRDEITKEEILKLSNSELIYLYIDYARKFIPLRRREWVDCTNSINTNDYIKYGESIEKIRQISLEGGDLNQFLSSKKDTVSLLKKKQL